MSDILQELKQLPTVADGIEPTGSEPLFYEIGEYCSNTNAMNYMIEKYGNRIFITKLPKIAFATYRAMNLSNYLKILDALKMEYNPIENYNRKEYSTVTQANGERTTKIGEQTFTNGNTNVSVSESAQTNGILNKHSVNPYDSSSYYENEKDDNTQTLGAKTTTTLGARVENTNGERTDKILNYTDSTTTDSSITGNIGVTTTQQMLQSEIELRMKSVIEMYYDNFINQYTFYTERE